MHEVTGFSLGRRREVAQNCRWREISQFWGKIPKCKCQVRKWSVARFYRVTEVQLSCWNSDFVENEICVIGLARGRLYKELSFWSQHKCVSDHLFLITNKKTPWSLLYMWQWIRTKCVYVETQFGNTVAIYSCIPEFAADLMPSRDRHEGLKRHLTAVPKRVLGPWRISFRNRHHIV